MERAVRLGEGVAVPLDPCLPAARPELGRPVAHGAQNEVRLLTVERPACEHPPGLHEKHRPVVLVQKVVGEVWTQLVAEQPADRTRRHTRR